VQSTLLENPYVPQHLWYLELEGSSTVCFIHVDCESEFEAIYKKEELATSLLWDVVPDRDRRRYDFWPYRSPCSSHIIILQQDSQHRNLYRRVGIAFINWSYIDKDGRRPKEIVGLGQPN
jgi:hypothetical protein